MINDGSAPRCLVRGGGDLATGVAWRLARAGWPVVVTELAAPLTVRRTVAFSTAVLDGEVTVEGVRAVRCDDTALAFEAAARGLVGVTVSPALPDLDVDVVVDARLAKRNIDTTLGDADLVIGLGPGFTAGTDCHAVVETMRGAELGRVFWSGTAAPDTGTPGLVAGHGAERVLRAPADGTAAWRVTIGDSVERDAVLGTIGGRAIAAPFDGVVRGLISEAVQVPAGLKVGDIDPRLDASLCHRISDKALAVAGGVLEAVLSHRATAVNDG